MIRLMNELQVVMWNFKNHHLDDLLEKIQDYFQHVVKLTDLYECLSYNYFNLAVVEKYDGLTILMNLLVQS